MSYGVFDRIKLKTNITVALSQYRIEKYVIIPGKTLSSYAYYCGKALYSFVYLRERGIYL